MKGGQKEKFSALIFAPIMMAECVYFFYKVDYY
jgi:hypothetical protein